MASFPRIEWELTAESKRFLEFVWMHYLKYQAWPSTWHVYRNLLEKPKLEAVLKNTSGALYTENSSQSPRSFELRLAGILNGKRGNEYRQWLVAFLEFLRDRFYTTQESQIIVTQAEAMAALRLSNSDTSELGRILQQGTFGLYAVWQPTEPGWQLYLPGNLTEDFPRKGSLERHFARMLDEHCEGQGRRGGRSVPTLATLALGRTSGIESWSETTADRSRRFQVFVSSTYKDLVKERGLVIQALLESRCIPAGMELFPAASMQQWKLIQEVIAESDYYLVLVAARYGDCVPGSKMSYTEREFEYARKIGKPILAFYHENPLSIANEHSERTAAGIRRLQQFTAKIKQKRMCGSWLEAAELPGVVKSAVQRAIEKQPQPGWVRAEF